MFEISFASEVNVIICKIISWVSKRLPSSNVHLKSTWYIGNIVVMSCKLKSVRQVYKRSFVDGIES